MKEVIRAHDTVQTFIQRHGPLACKYPTTHAWDALSSHRNPINVLSRCTLCGRVADRYDVLACQLFSEQAS